jgi:hypothetical protein
VALPVKALKAGQEAYWLDQIAGNREEYFSGRGESLAPPPSGRSATRTLPATRTARAAGAFITGTIKWGDANFALPQVRSLRGHTLWPPP